jgi:5'-3' exonuclease
MNILLGLFKKHSVGSKHPKVWFALEGEKGSDQRRKILPDYKGNRKERNFDPYEEVAQMCRYINGVTMGHPLLEADDVLAQMAHPKLRKNRRLLIVTGDRDLWLYVGRKNVGVWLKDHVVDVVEVGAEFGIDNPRALPLVKALFGDPSDNIKAAVPRLRKAPILKLINEWDVTTLAGFKDQVIPQTPGKVQVKLKKGWGALVTNWKCVRLHSKPMDALRKKKGPPTQRRLLDYLQEFQCKSQYDKIRVFWE